MKDNSAYIPNFSFNLSWLMIALLLLFMPFPSLYAQDIDEDQYEDPTEVFWGEDEEEYFEEDDEYYEDDTSEYYEDDEFYEDDTSEYYEDEEDFSDTELADKAKRIGYSMNITGASPGFVNHVLNTYNNNPQIHYRLSLEFPLLIQLAGTRFRFGIEVGNFGFENYLPVGGKISGITAMGLFSFPAGPGKVMFGTGLVGNRFGYSAAMSYGFSLGNTLEIRAGVRSTTAWDVIDDKDNVLGTVSWFDGLIMFGFNL